MRVVNNRGETVLSLLYEERDIYMSSKTSKFRKYILGGTLKVEPGDVRRVKWVNGACTDIELKSGETVRVKGGLPKVRDKLGLQVKPAGIGNYDLDPAKDKKLKHFVG